MLDDDVDMAAMHLSDKLAYQSADGRSSRFGTNNEPSEFDEEERYRNLMNSKLCISVRQNTDVASERQHCRDREAEEGEEGSSEGGNGNSNGNGTSSVGFTPKIDELERLLEAYFVQVDGTLNKLSTVRTHCTLAPVTLIDLIHRFLGFLFLPS